MNNKLYTQFVGSCSLVLFAFLGYVVKFYPVWIQPFDQVITNGVRSLYPTWNPFFLWITKFANPSTIVVLFLALLFVLIYGKRYAEAAWFSLGVIGISGIFNSLIKLLFMRERPTLEHLVTEHSYSFPSGHSTASMVLYGTLIFFVPLFIQNTYLKRGVQVLLGICIVLIGMSRIYLGVHFPSDIVGGFSLGLGWLLLTYPYYQKQRFVWRFKNKQL